MKFPIWIIRILLFVLLFVLVLHSTVEVPLVPPFDVVWHSPLILIALVLFVIGILLAMLAMAPHMMRHRFATNRLCHQIGRMKEAEAVAEVPMPVVTDSSYHALGPKV